MMLLHSPAASLSRRVCVWLQQPCLHGSLLVSHLHMQPFTHYSLKEEINRQHISIAAKISAWHLAANECTSKYDVNKENYKYPCCLCSTNSSHNAARNKAQVEATTSISCCHLSGWCTHTPWNFRYSRLVLMGQSLKK